MKTSPKLIPRDPLEEELLHLLSQLSSRERARFTREELTYPHLRRRWWARDDERGTRPLR